MKTITAIYENGVFKPQGPVSLEPGSRVDLIVPEPEDNPVAVLRARFPNSFGGMPSEDADEMAAIIEEECERVDPDAWK